MTPFDIVLVPFPFSDLTSLKQRPCLVLASFRPRSFGEHIIVSMITSQIKIPMFPYDVEITNWKEAGLLQESVARLSKVVTLEAQLIRKKLGSLQPKDQSKVKHEVRAMLSKVLAK